MKRLIVIALMLAAFTAQAQLEINKGPESRSISPSKLDNARYIGAHDSLNVWVLATRHGWKVMGLDHKMGIAGSAELRTKADELLTATINGNSATLILAERTKRNVAVLVAHIGLDGTTAVDTMANYAITSRKDRCLLWGATSPMGEKMGMVAVVEFAETKEYTSVAYVMDMTGKEIYHKEYALGSMQQMYVTDDGRIVTLDILRTSKQSTLTVNYVTPEYALSGDTTVNCEPIRDMEIVNVVGNRMLALGTINGPGRKGDKLCGGVVAFAYDLSSSTMINFNIRQFATEDVNVLYNRPTKKVSGETLPQNVSTVGMLAMPYGGVVALSRNFDKVTTHDNGTTTHRYTRMGLHVVAFNADGEMVWVHNIRRNDVSKKDGDMLRVGLFAIGDKLCIIKNESNKLPVEYDISYTAKEMMENKRSNIVIYDIASDGFVGKTIIETKTKHKVFSTTPEGDIITVRGHHVREITVE